MDVSYLKCIGIISVMSGVFNGVLKMSLRLYGTSLDGGTILRGERLRKQQAFPCGRLDMDVLLWGFKKGVLAVAVEFVERMTITGRGKLSVTLWSCQRSESKCFAHPFQAEAAAHYLHCDIMVLQAYMQFVAT